MPFVFAGYFPKHIERALDAMGLPGVSEVWSASNCISGGPLGWIDRWKHNRLGLFDSIELAQSVVPIAASDGFSILAFRVWSCTFDETGESPLDLSDLNTTSLPGGYIVVGYDAVSFSRGQDFECSPVSCNGGAKQFRVNEKCLFDTAEQAFAGARSFAAGHWEPGPYLVVEVLAPVPA